MIHCKMVHLENQPGVVDNPTPIPVKSPKVRKRNSMLVAKPLRLMPNAHKIDPANVTLRQLYLERKFTRLVKTSYKLCAKQFSFG